MMMFTTLLAFYFFCAHVFASDWDPTHTPYFPARRSDQTYVYESALHGHVTVPDPYSYLEDVDSEETVFFRTTQTDITQKYLDTSTDFNHILEGLNKTFNYERFAPPFPVNNVTWYYRIDKGLDAGDTWYAATLDDLLSAEQDNYAILRGTKFFDESLLSLDGTYTLTGANFSPSGKTMAYSISYKGLDWETFYFREADKPFVTASQDPVENGKGGPDRLPDVLENAKFTDFQWSMDEKGGFYKRFEASEADKQGQSDTAATVDGQIFYHVMGTDQKDDILVVAKDESSNKTNYGTLTTEDGNFLMLREKLGTAFQSRVYLAPLDQPISSNMKWLSVTPDFSYSLSYLHNVGNDFYWLTDANAPNWKIVRTRVDPTKAREVKHVTDLNDTLPLEDVVPESKDALLSGATVLFHDKLLLFYTKDVKLELYQHELITGVRVKRLLADFGGTFTGITGSLTGNQVFLTGQSLTASSITYRLTWSPDDDKNPRGTPNVFKHRTTKFKNLDLSAFVTKQVFVPSTDGVTVPMYIVYRNDTPLDGTAMSWLYFYGAYQYQLLPDFNPLLLWFLNEYRGVLLWVNARGGGEKGVQWWEDGHLLKKKNTFLDIIAAAQYAVHHQYVAKGKIIANGGSAGGLAALAVGNMAPEGLLGMIFANAPTADILRANLFTVGPANSAEFGSPNDSGEMFDYIYSYSPLHNVNASKVYPMIVCTTADHDDRVPPLHSYKMTAQLQYTLPNNPSPFLLRVNAGNGHALVSTDVQRIENTAEKFAMAVKHLGLKRKT